MAGNATRWLFVACALATSDAALSLLQTGAHPHRARQHQAPEEPELKEPEVNNDPTLPRMFVTQGCDGSTAILQHVYQILALHGINTGDVRQQKELLDPVRNPFIPEANNDIGAAMKLLNDDYRQKNRTLVFKGIAVRDDAAILMQSLRDMGTLVVLNSRANMLDQVVCMVRDCFVTGEEGKAAYGYPVDETGKESDLCFARRDTSVDAVDYKAKLVADKIVKNMLWLKYQVTTLAKKLHAVGYYAPTVTYEELVDFEADASLLPKATEAWGELLRAWGIEPNHDLLEAYLKEHVGTRDPPRPHRDVISNIDEVKEALEKAKKGGLIRE